MTPELEELLRRGPATVSSLHGVQREWVDDVALFAAAGWRADRPLGIREVEREVWVAPPDLACERNDSEIAGWRSGRWWRRFADGRFEQGHRDEGVEVLVARLARAWLDPGETLALLDLRLAGTGTVAGRRSLVLRGERRSTTDPMDERLWWLGRYADEWRIQVDAERGVVLGAEARHRGRPNTVTSFLSIAYDEPQPAWLSVEPAP